MLKTILGSSGWTQEQLAERLGVSFATVNSWLNGKSTPREAKLWQIQRLYLAQDTNEVRYITFANAGNTLVMGDEITLKKEGYSARAKIVFTHDNLAVAEIVEWG